MIIPVQAQTPLRLIRIVVIDSGLNLTKDPLKLCNSGIDLTNTSMTDHIGHGTNVSYIIANKLKGYRYCIYPIKIFDNEGTDIRIINKSLKIAKMLHPDIINISWGGIGPYMNESKIVRGILDSNIKIVAAAGNENTNLDKNCDYYPACYDQRIITVGNLTEDGIKDPLSNYGKYVKKWNVGQNIKAGGIIMTGTSQATAVETGKQALELLK